jgi:hypothetical protein
VLYRLPEILNARIGQLMVFVVEGEKDADALHRLGLLATTNAMGANSAWLPDYTATLHGRHVVIFPDNDKPGRDHADKVARALEGVAASVIVVELPGLPEKGDVSDWLAIEGNDKVKLLELVEQAMRKQPEGESPPGSGGAAERPAWEGPPAALNDESDPPGFPVKALPEWLASWASEVARETQVPADLPALLALTVCGAGLARRYRVLVRGNWTEPTNIYTVVALPPGDRKSAVFGFALAPVMDLEAELVEASRAQLAIAASERRMLENRLANAEKAAARETDPAEAYRLKQEAKKLAQELGEQAEAYPP